MRRDGFTLPPAGGGIPRSGFALAVAPRLGWSIPTERFDPRHVGRFVRTHAALFGRHPGLHAGGWCDGRTVHLDLSMVEPDGDRALHLAHRLGQRCVYDLARGRILPTRR